MENPLKKIIQLTTATGIYQHGTKDNPKPEFGYAIEDQARALIAAHELGNEKLKQIYLKFIENSQRPDGLFYQYYYEDERGFANNNSKIETKKSQESFAIVLWALLATNHYSSHKKYIDILIANSLKWEFLRPVSEALLGLTKLPQKTNEENILTNRLKEAFKQNSCPDWHWFENKLTYGNALLPWAFWEVYLARKENEIKEIAEKSTRFLIETCQINGIPCPIGNKGWYVKGGKKALYNQQPIDPAYMVCCLEKAFLATKDNYYLEWAKKWWQWFWGNNLNKVSMISDKFSSYDGLNKEGPNKNSGAESNICFIMAYLAAKRLKIVTEKL